MTWMKEYSLPRLSKSRDASYNGSYSPPGYNKDSKIVYKTVQCWFNDLEYDAANNYKVKYPTVFKLTQRLELATGFNITGRNASLHYQTTFYGLGGLCERHMDSYGNLENLEPTPGEESREQFLFYLEIRLSWHQSYIRVTSST